MLLFHGKRSPHLHPAGIVLTTCPFLLALVSQHGIKFHPKEFAYLNESVCREAQGKDPTTKTYPPLTGPSLLQHFKLRETHLPNHTERAERLRKMAEQIPTVTMATSNMSSVSLGPLGTAAAESSSAATATVGSGVGNGAAATAQTSTPLGPPRPTKSTSSGLFVSRKPAGSFLRNNAPRPMILNRSMCVFFFFFGCFQDSELSPMGGGGRGRLMSPRWICNFFFFLDPSATQLPLRSPRLDGPTTPRLNQKTSRIQILDIQEGTEIIQSMNDAKVRKEQGMIVLGYSFLPNERRQSFLFSPALLRCRHISDL